MSRSGNLGAIFTYIARGGRLQLEDVDMQQLAWQDDLRALLTPSAQQKAALARLKTSAAKLKAQQAAFMKLPYEQQEAKAIAFLKKVKAAMQALEDEEEEFYLY